MTDTMISNCGLVCTVCPTFIATQKNDDAAREQIARDWSALYGAPFSPEDINCDGCQSEGGTLFSYCTKCSIRACAHERSYTTCAECPDFGCDKLTPVHNAAPDAKERLEGMRK